MLVGMVAGTIAVGWAWQTNVAWTWYALIGAAVTWSVALALSVVLPRRAHA
jgi:hypothetical protein